ncbi:hypothetical protein ABZW03_08350 [Kitasatospora sp. NPDC004799]|uniref:hypothetical protein n=1 Tax=Kitasatospora sp. NPDC004799 TaxID=3154460 RepID=UPI0033B5C655
MERRAGQGRRRAWLVLALLLTALFTHGHLIVGAGHDAGETINAIVLTACPGSDDVTPERLDHHAPDPAIADPGGPASQTAVDLPDAGGEHGSGHPDGDQWPPDPRTPVTTLLLLAALLALAAALSEAALAGARAVPPVRGDRARAPAPPSGTRLLTLVCVSRN